jgi:hypothetical protein
MGEYNWRDKVLNRINKLFNCGYYETKTPLVDPHPIPEIKINSIYPYTVEQTIKVTHYSKPKRRDPARNWTKK